MKKDLFFIIFTFFALILVTGCGSKNNERVEIMENLVGTWEYEVNTDNYTVTGAKSTFSFDNNYKFTFKNVVIFRGNKEMTLRYLTGTYELNMDTKKIILTFDDKEESDGLIEELPYKYENGNFALFPKDNGDETYSKK